MCLERISIELPHFGWQLVILGLELAEEEYIDRFINDANFRELVKETQYAPENFFRLTIEEIENDVDFEAEESSSYLLIPQIEIIYYILISLRDLINPSKSENNKIEQRFVKKSICIILDYLKNQLDEN